MSNKKHRSLQASGYILTMIGSSLWAVGGACGQVLFRENEVTSNWLVPIRILIAGAVLLLVARATSAPIMEIWHDKKDAKNLILFGILGASASQYTYYTCIEYSNTAFATVISYIFPVLILIYSMFHEKRLPKNYEWISVVLVTLGTFTCVTHWNLTKLSVSVVAVVVGLLCAVAAAYNTVKPRTLLQKYNLLTVMGWSMIIGGVVLMICCRPWRIHVIVNSQLFIMMSVIIVGGTIFAFCCYQAGVKIVGGVVGGVLTSAEAVTAVAISVTLLNVPLTWADWLGFALILLTIPIIALGQKKELPTPRS